MNGLVIITNRQKLFICLGAIAFIILSAFFIAKLDFPRTIETDSSRVSAVMSPENENQHLKDVLSSILPAKNNVLYESTTREIAISKKTEKEQHSVSDVIEKGKSLAYLFIYSDDEYLRPIYTNLWKQSFYQGWLFLPSKIIAARHSLFTYTGGAGKVFDIEGQLGFYPNITIDNQNYLNFLIYNFDLDNVAQLGNDIAISGKPVKKGVQIISIKLEDVRGNINENGNIAVHLCTPAGNELDYQNLPFSKDTNRIEDYGPVHESYTESSYNETDLSSMEISQQNVLLKQELTHFVSDSTKPIFFMPNGTYETAESLSNLIDLEDALKNSKAVDFSFIYNNKKYISPVFHPQWKEHYNDRGWCYIPRKIYLNMKRVYFLPSDREVAADLLGELGFFEKFTGVSKSKIGIAVQNFNIQSIGLHENSIIVKGTPSRTGMQIVEIDKKSFDPSTEYVVRLVTPDACEIDNDVIKN